MNKLILICVLLPLALGFPRFLKPNTPENVERLEHLQPNENAEYLAGQYQGDMVLTPDQEDALFSPFRNGLINTWYRWVGNTVPYEFAPSITTDQRTLIRSALNRIEEVSCIKFVPRTTQVDHVYVTNENTGCWSYVGMIDGRQELNLQSNGCMWFGTIIHEFLHALGFYHMQSSTERDSYVNILWNNITPGYEHNFDKHPATQITNFGEAYDMGSVMHYSATAFSSNGQNTIQPIDPNISPNILGQRADISGSDARRVRAMYQC